MAQRKNNRRVKVVQTGIIYENVAAMAKDYEVTPSAIYKHISGTRGKHPLSIQIVWVNESEAE